MDDGRRDVAHLSPASVHRILNDADLLYRWKRSSRTGEKPEHPRSHTSTGTDIMYLRVADVGYFLATVLDGFSRYVVHWELLTSMRVGGRPAGHSACARGQRADGCGDRQ